jgi:hypothetical protein
MAADLGTRYEHFKNNKHPACEDNVLGGGIAPPNPRDLAEKRRVLTIRITLV